jgi:ribosomal-protein-alanine N-acetyltransferase
MNIIARLLTRREPALVETRPSDAGSLARLHAASFHRGWSEDEFHRLLLERNVVSHQARIGRSLAGFILSRIAADEAEILSVAVDARWRGRGLARALLGLHLRRLAGLEIKAVFLEVEEANVAAQRLYGRAGFREVGRRDRYYSGARAAPAAALVLRRDLL